MAKLSRAEQSRISYKKIQSNWRKQSKNVLKIKKPLIT